MYDISLSYMSYLPVSHHIPLTIILRSAFCVLHSAFCVLQNTPAVISRQKQTYTEIQICHKSLSSEPLPVGVNQEHG